MKKLIYISSALLLACALLAGCEKINQPGQPGHYGAVELEPTMSILDFRALCADDKIDINQDIIIVGKVISSDESGNIYRSFFIQDETSGLEIMEGTGNNSLHKKYPIGTRISVSAKGLTLGRNGNGGVPRLGYRTTGYNTTWLNAPLLIKSTIGVGNRYTPVAPKEITTFAELTAEATMGTYVTIKNVTYMGGNTMTATHPKNTWAIKNDPDTPEDESAYGEQKFRFTASSSSTEFMIRSSGYARFAETELPFQTGAVVNITCIAGRYASSNYQMTIMSTADVVVVQP